MGAVSVCCFMIMIADKIREIILLFIKELPFITFVKPFKQYRNPNSYHTT